MADVICHLSQSLQSFELKIIIKANKPSEGKKRMNNENDLEREFLVYAAKAELKQHQKMTETKTDINVVRLENELVDAYRELIALKRELIQQDKKIDELNQEVKKLKNEGIAYQDGLFGSKTLS